MRTPRAIGRNMRYVIFPAGLWFLFITSFNLKLAPRMYFFFFSHLLVRGFCACCSLFDLYLNLFAHSDNSRLTYIDLLVN